MMRVTDVTRSMCSCGAMVSGTQVRESFGILSAFNLQCDHRLLNIYFVNSNNALFSPRIVTTGSK